MKKTALLTGMLSFATAATAQSSVTLFGVLDAGVSYYSSKSQFYNNTDRPVLPPAVAPAVTRSQTALSNSGNSNSRLGFRGTEDLGGGLSSSFWLEAALANDSGLGGGPGGAIAFNRRSTVSMSGRFGEIRLGRDYTPTFWNDTVFSPFTTVGVGANVVSTVGANLAGGQGPGIGAGRVGQLPAHQQQHRLLSAADARRRLWPASVCAARERRARAIAWQPEHEGPVRRWALWLCVRAAGRGAGLCRKYRRRRRSRECCRPCHRRRSQREDQDDRVLARRTTSMFSRSSANSRR